MSLLKFEADREILKRSGYENHFSFARNYESNWLKSLSSLHSKRTQLDNGGEEDRCRHASSTNGKLDTCQLWSHQAEGRKKQMWYRGIGSSKRLLFGHFWYEEEISFENLLKKICKSAKRREEQLSFFSNIWLDD